MAKVSRKVLREEVKAQYLKTLMDFLKGEGEDAQQTGSNKFMLPVVDREGNEDFVVVTISIPTGSQKDNEPYDGYAEAESYAINCKVKKEKAAEAAAKKAAKIKRDEEYRKKQKEQKEAREKEGK